MYHKNKIERSIAHLIGCVTKHYASTKMDTTSVSFGLLWSQLFSGSTVRAMVQMSATVTSMRVYYTTRYSI